jgi:hypothetical protein
MTAGPADEQFEGASMSMPSPSPMEEVVDSEIENAVPRNRKRPRVMRRLVSQDDTGMEVTWQASCKKDNSVEASQRADSPVRCVSEFDDVKPSIPKVHPLPNPLDDPSVLKTHVSALRLESDLYPMRLILARLMAHPTLNRKGLFNRPVDAVALGILDYHTVVTQPMDLGTVKGRLHAVAYQSRQQVADDIWLVFANAIRYNPPHNAVHKFAKELLESFEQAYLSLGPTESPQLVTLPSNNQVVQPTAPLPPLASLASAVSSVEDEKPQQDASKVVSMEAESVIQSMPADDAAPIPAVSTEPGPLPTETVSSELPTSQPPAPVPAPVHTQETRTQVPALGAFPKPPKKRSSLPPFLPHTCQACQGRTCAMCKQGCLAHEPSLLICGGYNCAGAKIRKGAAYHISKDGSHHFCQRCYANLPSVLPNTTDEDVFRYKQDLLKRKNEEEIVEEWINCRNCNLGVHQVCAMHNGFVHSETSYLCPDCQVPSDSPIDQKSVVAEEATKRYTFVSGSDIPVPLSSVAVIHEDILSADSLAACAISAFIESKVQDRMVGVPNADKTVTVRVISDCSRHFIVPEVVRNHFRMAADSDDFVRPPSKVNYKQKAIALFQKMDGLDVCIFCMYVQEYDGNDEYDEDSMDFAQSTPKKRVYIAYLDSVEHFRPRQCRTEVYHEILVSYLATARERGFQTAHIWACPPSRGNSFVFWNHPASQRTPNKEHLISWYHGALSRAIDCGVVTDVKSLFESDFEDSITQLEKEVDAEQVGELRPDSGKMLCPPLLDGDFWIEEAVRVHSISIARNLKTRPSNEICVWNIDSHSFENVDPCPAMQLASLLRDRIMTHPSSVPFRKPVNAAALKLKNYHMIVTKPMDLGTVYSRCVLGEYSILREVVKEVELVVSNAKKFNPVGHYVHIKADEIRELFFQELTALTKMWSVDSDADQSWECHSEMSMNLNMTLELTSTAIAPQTGPPTSVVIEDDRSSDGSRSLASTISGPASPMSGISSLKDEDSVRKPCSSSVSMALSREKVSNPKVGRKAKKIIPLKKLDLLVDGPEAVQLRMVGDDTWLLDKRIAAAPKPASAKKAGGKRRRNSIDSTSEDPSAKRRRQSWLGEEIGDSVRKMRDSFFTCMLAPKESLSDQEREKAESYRSYVQLFESKDDPDFAASSRIADARGTLLEFSQFRHFEFDTLRRAKYSTAMLLYHLHHEDAPGMVPICTGCDQEIQEIRWHKVKKVAEKRRLTKFAPIRAPEPVWVREELCVCCYPKHSKVDEFIPIPVTVKSSY